MAILKIVKPLSSVKWSPDFLSFTALYLTSYTSFFHFFTFIFHHLDSSAHLLTTPFVNHTDKNSWTNFILNFCMDLISIFSSPSITSTSPSSVKVNTLPRMRFTVRHLKIVLHIKRHIEVGEFFQVLRMSVKIALLLRHFFGLSRRPCSVDFKTAYWCFDSSLFTSSATRLCNFKSYWCWMIVLMLWVRITIQTSEYVVRIIKNKRPGKFVDGFILRWEEFEYPPYSPNSSPCHFHQEI